MNELEKEANKAFVQWAKKNNPNPNMLEGANWVTGYVHGATTKKKVLIKYKKNTQKEQDVWLLTCVNTGILISVFIILVRLL